jgi:hypothetical protein
MSGDIRTGFQSQRGFKKLDRGEARDKPHPRCGTASGEPVS